jgi:glutathione peroxidase
MPSRLERNDMSDLLEMPVTTLEGKTTTFGALSGRRATLIVNVASRCGLTPQYASLEALQEELADHGFTVLGFPCNQFAGEEPGSSAEIANFCSATYGVTFPMSSKVKVNGPHRDPLYRLLTATPDRAGKSGDVEWNFEKFVVAADGRVAGRFRPRIEPDDLELRACIEDVMRG